MQKTVWLYLKSVAGKVVLRFWHSKKKVTLGVSEIFGFRDWFFKFFTLISEETELAISSLSATHKHKLIEFCAKWNRNSKTAFRAQMTLKVIFSSMPFEELLSDFGIRKQLESLLPFTDRYRRKIDNLRIQSRFANFAISAVKVAPVMNEWKSLRK